MFSLINWLAFPCDFSYNYQKNNYIINGRNTNIMETKTYTKNFSYLKNYNNNEYIKLNHPITFEINIDNDGFYYTNEEYNIYAYGTTQQRAEQDVFEEFELQYNEYALEDDNNLEANAKTLKYKLLKIFGGKNA